jgi:hypothetical protein
MVRRVRENAASDTPTNGVVELSVAVNTTSAAHELQEVAFRVGNVVAKFQAPEVSMSIAVDGLTEADVDPPPAVIVNAPAAIV